jgi:hypothetical protein
MDPKVCPYYKEVNGYGGVGCTYMGFFGYDEQLNVGNKICNINT